MTTYVSKPRTMTASKMTRLAADLLDLLAQLEAENANLSYSEAAEWIGLTEAAGWQPWHRSQVTHLLNGAFELNKGVDVDALPASAFGRLVNKATGEPGPGFFR